jgi:hypothetical protein
MRQADDFACFSLALMLQCKLEKQIETNLKSLTKGGAME